MDNQTENRNAILNDAARVIGWLVEHPDIPLPSALENLQIFSWNTKEEAATMTRAFGTCEKSADEYFFYLTKRFGTVSLQGLFNRNAVCERVVVGTKEVENEEPDPVALAALPKVKVKKQIEIVEWHCPEVLNGKESV